MMKIAAPPRPAFIWACVLAAAADYVVMGGIGLIAAVICLASFAVVRRFAGSQVNGATAALAVLAALPLTAACLAGAALLAGGLLLDLCYAIIHPKLFFPLLLWSGLVYAGWFMLSFPPKTSLLWRSEAVVLIMLGLALSPGSWQRLRAAEQSRLPSEHGPLLGWRFRFSGPEGGAEKPRFYVKTSDPAHPYSAVDQCPARTRPRPAKRVQDGALCE